MKQSHLITLLLLTSSLLFTACDTTSSDVEDELFVLRASDVEADPGTRDPQTGQLSSNNTFTLYSLADNEIVLPPTKRIQLCVQRTQQVPLGI